MQIIFVSNEQNGRRLISEARVGDEYQLLVAPAELGWYLVVSVTPDESFHFLAAFQQEAEADPWLLWTSDPAEKKCLVKLPLAGGHEDSLVFDAVGTECVLLINVPRVAAEEIGKRDFMALCEAAEVRLWTELTGVQFRSFSCKVEPKRRR